MPESFDEAARQGVRRAVRDFFAGLGAPLGKGLGWLIVGCIFFFVVMWAAEWVWDGFTSPFRGAWSWVAGKWDGGVHWATDWWPGGDTVVGPAVDTAQEVVKETPTETGPICSRTGDWNWFCK